MSEREAFLRAVCESPGDDTPRLVFADWLDEHGDQPDDAARAEFIRLQFRLSQPFVLCSPVCSQEYGHADSCELELQQKLRERERDLLAAHPEWSRCPCPRMADRMWGPSDPRGCSLACSICNGTGDLFVQPVQPGYGRSGSPLVTWSRGFPDSVPCTLAQAFKRNDTPTPWSLTVVTQTPVTRFVLTDREPLERQGTGNRFRWWSESPQIGRTLDIRYAIPRFLFSELVGDSKAWENLRPVDFCWEYATSARAVDALALAAGRVVRRHAYPERK